MITRILSAVAIAAGLAAAPLSAQLSSSTNFQWIDVSFDAAGGGASSETTVAFWTLDHTSGDASASINNQADPGLHGGREMSPGSDPFVFAVIPKVGDRLGGEPVSIHGMNFVAGTSITLGSATVMSPTIVSPTMITATTGPQSFGIVGYGPQVVTASNGFGSAQLSDGFIAEPAVVASLHSFQGATWTLDAYGEPGQIFQTWISPTTLAPGTAPTEFGQVQIGPTIVSLLFLNFPYGPTGHLHLEFDIPIDPILEGFTLYIQNLHFGDIVPGELSNQTQTTFH